MVVRLPAPVITFVLPPVAPTALMLPKKAVDGCNQAWLLMSGHWLRVKLGAWASLA